MPSSRKKHGKTTLAWRQVMMTLYPDLYTDTICVPPVILNRVPYTRDTVAGQPVLVVQEPSDTDCTQTSTPSRSAVTSQTSTPSCSVATSQTSTPRCSAATSQTSTPSCSAATTKAATPSRSAATTQAATPSCSAATPDSQSDQYKLTPIMHAAFEKLFIPGWNTLFGPDSQTYQDMSTPVIRAMYQKLLTPGWNMDLGADSQPKDMFRPLMSMMCTLFQKVYGAGWDMDFGSESQSDKDMLTPFMIYTLLKKLFIPFMNVSFSSLSQSDREMVTLYFSTSFLRGFVPGRMMYFGSGNEDAKTSSQPADDGQLTPACSQSVPAAPVSGSVSQTLEPSASPTEISSKPSTVTPPSVLTQPAHNLQPTPQSLQDNSPTTQSAQDQSHSPTPQSAQNNSPTLQSAQDHSPTPQSAQDHSPTPQSAQDHSPTPQSAQDHSSTPQSAQDHSSTPQSAQDHSSTPHSAQDQSHSLPAAVQGQLTPKGQPQGQCTQEYSMWSSDPSPHTAPRNVLKSDARDDFAQQFVLTNLQALGRSRREVMFVLSQLNFTSYLNEPSEQKATRGLPRPSLGKANTEGDFDILVIHRHHGILIAELKSVGLLRDQLKRTEAQSDNDVAKRVHRAIKQLTKSEAVVRHLLGDIAPNVMVRTTVILPFVTSAQLLRILTNDLTLNKTLCSTLGAATVAEATSLCVCSDQLSQPATHWHVTEGSLSSLTAWWQHRMACTVDNSLDDTLYLDIVARFAGPATSVTVQCTVPPRLNLRTLGQAVSYLGETFSRLTLTPQQIDLLNRAPQRVYIKGPPGTGKTVTLVLKGLQWLMEGHDVYIFSHSIENLAVSEIIAHQLRTTAALYTANTYAPVGQVHLLAYDAKIDEIRELSRMMTDVANLYMKGGSFHFIVDEMMFGKGALFTDNWILHPVLWVLEVISRKHHVWMAGVLNQAMCPSYEEAVLTIPLRCSPAIQREVESGTEVWIKSGRVQSYASQGITSPSDGLTVIRLQHEGADHQACWPVDCEKCGHNIASLLHQLGVGGKANPRTPNCPAPLRYKDVFIVTRSSHLQDDVMDDTGKVTTTASGVVRGLRSSGVPVVVLPALVRVYQSNWRQKVLDIGLATSDRVTVSFTTFLQGLERKVVVWLPGQNQDMMDEYVTGPSEVLDRIHAVSRCTTQLVIVERPQCPCPVDLELD